MNRRAARRLGLISTFGFLLSVMVVAPVLALGYSQDIGVNFTFNSSIVLDLTSSDIVISSLVPNTAADSNIVTVNVLTNNVAGYTLNATVGNNTTYNTRDLVHSDTTQTAKFSSVDYSATPTITANSSLDPNTWAYSYSTDNGTTWANYNGLPLWSDNEHVATLKDSNAPVANTTGDAIKFKIAAKADALQASGTYNNVINFTLVAKPVPTTLAMAYADAGATQLNGYYRIQDMTTSICSAVEVEEDALEVIDIRDNQLYHIAKLADHRCWLLDNLALDLINVDIAILKGNTNASDEALAYLKNGGGTTTDQYPTAGVTTFTSDNNYSIPNMIASGTCYDTNCANNPESGKWTSDSVVGAIAGSAGNNKIGIYYNYCAASAGTYCWGDGTSYTGSPETDPYTDELRDVSEDICPKNWHLPTSDTGSEPYGEYRTLYRAYSPYSNSKKALSTPLSGWYYSGSARNQGALGYWWSSTWDNYYRMRVLTMTTLSNYNLSNGNNRSSGLSVRCIAN